MRQAPSFSSSLRICLSAAVILALISLISAPAHATYPAPLDDHVNDFAEILTPKQTTEIQGLLQGHRDATGVHIVVATVHSFSDYSTGASTVEDFATGLFNRWGIGDGTDHNGVLLLLAHADRKVRIEVGTGYGSRLDDTMQRIVDQEMVPRFRAGDFGYGLVVGVRSIVQELSSGAPTGPVEALVTTPSPKRPTPVTQPRRTSSSPSKGWFVGLFGGLIALFAMTALFAVLGLRTYFRNRPRRCQECPATMFRLGEAVDDAYLDPGQRKEESLKSVDYDVWRCPMCGSQTVETYRSWFSRYKPCPSCHHRTSIKTRSTIRRATRTRTGKDRIVQSCEHCNHRHERDVITPMLPQPSSSGGSAGSSGFSRGGGSSFGGGRSSGGGAGGSW